MAKRKRHQRLPSGWGSIRYLGKGRRNPYAVHPPCKEQDQETGRYIRPPALCYVDDWYVGFAVLNAYRAGTYHPGDELGYKDALSSGGGDVDKFVERILADSGRAPAGEKLPTFSEIYDQWYEWKCGEKAAKELSESHKKRFRASYNHFAPLHDRAFRELTIDDFQGVINHTDVGRGFLVAMKSLLSQMSKWAESRGLCEKDLSRFIVIPASAKDDEHGIPFTADEVKELWAHRDDEYCELALCLCYSGHRIGEYETVVVDMEDKVFIGGNKSEAGKDKVVPIHPAIMELVENRLEKYGKLLRINKENSGAKISKAADKLGFEGHHTAHDCRHTFSMLCEHFGVPENDRKRLMGHSFGKDITNKVYGHRSLADLRASIELIPWPEDL